MGCTLTRPSTDTIRCQGKLRSGAYYIDGGVSSQYITGLMLGLSLLPEKSQLHITGRLESAPYVHVTEKVLEQFSTDPNVLGGQRFRSPGTICVEGDWSNAAFFLAARHLGQDVKVTGLSADSPQGDKMIFQLLPLLATEMASVSATDIPDLIPILAVFATVNYGAVFTDIQRLRWKESDRVASVMRMLHALGGRAEVTESTLTVHPQTLCGGTVDSCNDHRIAMAAAIAATVCKDPVTILGAQSVNKSYPTFWAEYRRLGGNYEQFLR
jgi:3-phosphoshikimate 1-carboxyvinyltransferase